MARRPNGLLVGRMRIPLGVIADHLRVAPQRHRGRRGPVRQVRQRRHAARAARRRSARTLPSPRSCARRWRKAGLPADAVSVHPRHGPRGDRRDAASRRRASTSSSRGEARGSSAASSEKSRIPVIKHYKGVCHIFVDEAADIDLAVRVCVNAKAQRPGVCNAMETLLVHEAIAPRVPARGRRRR